MDILLLPIRATMKLLIWFESWFYRLRELIWSYPDYLFTNDDSLTAGFYRLYSLARPYSHIVAAIFIMMTLLVIVASYSSFPLLAFSSSRLVEGVVMGTDAQGQIQRLSKVNPLVPSSLQLEQDLSELIYEPLIRYEQDGEVKNVLAENVIRRSEGSIYTFEVKEGVLWHDGSEFTVDDVIATLELMRSLENQDNTYVRAIRQIGWERIGAREITLCTVSEANLSAWSQGSLDLPCTNDSAQKPILSNFLELLSIKIMPAHLIDELNTLNIETPEPLINRSPVGTGPFRFAAGDSSGVTLERFDSYHEGAANIGEIYFKFFVSEDAAVSALQNGEIHSLATVSTVNLRGINDYPQITALESEVLGNQYWAIYFNLRKNPEGEPLGPSFFQDTNVRRAIALAINDDRILESLLGVGARALGPIYSGSDFFNPDANWPNYDPAVAAQLLDDAGWVLGADGFRYKGDERLSFELTHADSYDRNTTVGSITQDLAAVGVEVLPDPRSSEELVSEVVTPKLFDTLLYGMHTFIDPDRYELFHSSETTGLNLSGYVGSEETVQIRDGDSVRVPKVDRLLEVGRSLDPLDARDTRSETYNEFQSLIAEDVPVVFLYNPQFLYYTNNRLQDVDLQGADSLERRFINIPDWNLE